LVEEAVAALRKEEPGLVLWVESRWGWAELSILRVPWDRRGQGVFRRVVDVLTEAADLAGVGLAVTPTGEFGADLERLRRFYEGYGFVRNTGERRDWDTTADYIRPVGGGR
jgi:GNAT superfamily N-acetyltransferase